VGHCGAEISDSFICRKFSSFTHEVLETTLFQNGCLAFGSPARRDLCLKLKSSVVFVSFQAWSGDLQTAASSTSLLPLDMQTPMVSIKTSGDRSAWLWGMPLLTATAVPPVLPGTRSFRCK
jgi:hypothetical protein